jgi:hypothetical protein
MARSPGSPSNPLTRDYAIQMDGGTVPLGRTAAVGKAQVRTSSLTGDSLEDGTRTDRSMRRVLRTFRMSASMEVPPRACDC